MKEKRSKEKHRKSHKKDKKREKRKRRSSSSNSSESDEWVEKESSQKSTENQKAEREDWMAMTGMMRTYTKDDIRTKREEKDKKHIDSYNPSTSSRELNPYWRDGGSGLPQTAESFRQSAKFLKPQEDDDYYTKSSDRKLSSHKQFLKPAEDDDDDFYKSSSRGRNSSYLHDKNLQKKDYHMKHTNEDRERKYEVEHERYSDRKPNWRKRNTSTEQRYNDLNKVPVEKSEHIQPSMAQNHKEAPETTKHDSKYLSDEKMNKLGAKIVKAEIMGNTKLAAELKEKLEAAREYRKQNPAAEPDEDRGIMLIATNSTGNSRPLTNTSKGDARSKGGKRKADTHNLSGERAKYFGNDDKYNLAQMFQNEKYGNNYDDEAELARIASKSKNPNDDLEDIFMDEISKNRNDTKDAEAERNRAIKQYAKIEKSLEGCEYCVESKNMLKHLMVSCGSKVYVAVPSRKSLVQGHCIISTIQHSLCVTALDEDVWEEVMNYRKALTQLFNSQDKDVVFFETATKLHRFPHMVINCVPLPRDVGDMAAIYFKKALLECEAEWSMNKKVVDLKGKNIRKGVPKGLPYFWIDFGMDSGFAHVIEDQQLFPKTFAEEVIAGILDLDHSHWKNPRKEYGDIQRKKVLDFINEWKPFDPVTKE